MNSPNNKSILDRLRPNVTVHKNTLEKILVKYWLNIENINNQTVKKLFVNIAKIGTPD